MSVLKTYIEKLGGLHDAVVESISWSPSKNRLEMVLEDIHSNFEGLPEYPGKAPGRIVFEEIRAIDFDLEFSDKNLRIFEMGMEPETGAGEACSVSFSPAGKIKIAFGRVELPAIGLP